jgi:tetratricopeptide (TPR) repeat protein
MLLPLYVLGQTSDKELALTKGREAIKLIDDGKYDDAIKLLKESQTLDPNNIDYPYEMALAYAYKKDYKKSIKILTPLKQHPDVKPIVYQLLGNSYDHNKQSKKAIEIYDEGIKLFPDYPNLYFEKGVVYTNQKEYNKALTSYEEGIKANPKYPSNYYASAAIFALSSEKVWAVLYGEIFMNLERASPRTEAMSKVLYETYRAGIRPADTSLAISFTKNYNIVITDSTLSEKGGVKLPFAAIAFEGSMLVSSVTEKTIDLDALDRIRSRFIDHYYEKGLNEKYPVVLFDYQKQIKDAGHFEAYNHWLLMKGDEPAFNKWRSQNEEKWKAFIAWYKENPLKLDKDNFFHATKYISK